MNTRFKKALPLRFILATTAIIPALYYICLILTKNKFIFLFQIGFFFLPALLIFKRYTIQNITNRVSIIKNTVLTIGITVLMTVILNELLTYWLRLFPPPDALAQALENLMSLDQKFGLIKDLALLSVVPAICEEFFFRGFLQTALKAYVKPHNAIVVASVIFALYHANPWFAPFYFILAFLFGAIYEKTRNLGLAILAHFINNAYGIVMSHYFGVSF